MRRLMAAAPATVDVALAPVGGLGAGDEAPRVALDHLLLEVEYRLP